MRNKINTLAFLLLVIAADFSLSSQTYNFKNFTEDDGLPQSYIYCITQNHDGFLYLSTGDGFCKFGGPRFMIYNTRDSLAGNFDYTHFTDSKGTTWIGHFQEGVSFLKDGHFGKLKGTGAIGNKINCFDEDPDGKVWFVAQQKGIFRTNSTLGYDTISLDLETPVNILHFDHDGNILLATREGAYLYKEMFPNKNLVCAVVGLEGKNVTLLVPQDSLKTIYWAAVPGEGLFKLKKTGDCYQIITKISAALGSSTMNFSALYFDQNQNLWIALQGEGLRKISFNDNNANGSYYITQITRKNGLTNEFIQSIFQDFEGNLWFGTLGGGLIEMPMNKFNYYSSGKPLEPEGIHSILIDPDNRTILLGMENGLNLFNPQNSGENTHFNAGNGFVDDQVNSLAKDSDGTIWIGTSLHGLYSFDFKTKKFKMREEVIKPDVRTINSISINAAGTMFVGTTEGAFICDKSKTKYKTFTTVDGLLHNNVQQIFEDRQKRIWFASHGAVPFYLKNGEFTFLKNIPDMKFFNINSIIQDDKDRLWIATEGDGVYCYNGSEFKNYRVNQGLLSNFCYFVLSDKNQTIWVGHKNGLSKLEAGELTFSKITKSDGLLFPENNLNASAKDSKGNAWFGTSLGIVNYDCSGSKINLKEPRTSILSITINDQVYQPEEEIILPYKTYSAKIDFIGISLVDAGKVSYKCRLLGLDTVWSYVSNRFAEYPKITEGQYTFQLMACNNDGVWNRLPVEIHFEINAPFWKKTWFYTASSILLVAGIYLIILWRTRSLIRARELLRRLVDEKTLLLKQEKENVEQIKFVLEEKNKDITDSINYAKRIQEAILPSNEAIQKNFPKAFIYYKPKDIVSGDFYWFLEIEAYYFIAAVDCTGHGVPGAFMSLIATTLLNEIVKNKKISSPCDILQSLNDGIIEALKQTESENSSRDGMDMALCRVDKQKEKLVFSGAARPFYHIRNTNLTEVKGQGYPIGGHYGLMNLKYTNFEMDLEPDDMFYITSDGFADQFRYDDKKKFSTKRLKALLLEIAGLSPEAQQERLNSEFEIWKGDAKQIDDILIVGIRI